MCIRDSFKPSLLLFSTKTGTKHALPFFICRCHLRMKQKGTHTPNVSIPEPDVFNYKNKLKKIAGRAVRQ